MIYLDEQTGEQVTLVRGSSIPGFVIVSLADGVEYPTPADGLRVIE